MMRTLEASMGARLLHRTTRSVSATEAGERLVARLQPVLRDFDLLYYPGHRHVPSGLRRSSRY